MGGTIRIGGNLKDVTACRASFDKASAFIQLVRTKENIEIKPIFLGAFNNHLIELLTAFMKDANKAKVTIRDYMASYQGLGAGKFTGNVAYTYSDNDPDD
jgi:hypothetical protein